MYSVGSYPTYYNYNTTSGKRAGKVEVSGNAPEIKVNNYATNPISNDRVPFNPAFAASKLRTRLNSQEEKNKYNTVLSYLDSSTKKKMKTLLKSGVLLNSESNDNSTVLDNLYNIAVNDRAQGLSREDILKNTIATIADPHIITQQFGDIPVNIREHILENYMKDNKLDTTQRKSAETDINVVHSGTCVASSIEFNLAKKMPAEFARFAEGLTSPAMSVKKNIKMKNLTDNTLDSVWLLNAFEIPFKMDDYDNANITFAPDKNAIIRARIQTTNRDSNERSALDVLMQSTFMQVGSQQTYDSLSDKRKGKFNNNDKGLIEFEKTFTESVVEDKNKISVTYQTVDDDARLTGYETDFETMKKQISDALNLGENVIIGYTEVDKNNKIINGHEITITGQKYDKSGNLVYICNDTDDDIPSAIEYRADILLPKIHHAGLPQSVVKEDVNLVENWVEGLKSYKEMKKKQLSQAETLQNAA